MRIIIPAMIDIARLQSQLRFGAAQAHETIPCPPFSMYYNADSDSLHANYAIPDKPAAGNLTQAIIALKTIFHTRGRTPRLEYLEDYAPALAAALEANGFREEVRTLLMVCTPESFRPSAVPGLTIHPINDRSPLEAQRAAVTIQRRAFGGEEVPGVSEEEARQYYRRYASQQMFLARMDGDPASVASLMPAHAGIAEIAGIGTAAAHRRRGIGAAITAHAVAAAFEAGLEAVFLTALDARAGSVYARVGFEAAGHGLAYVSAG